MIYHCDACGENHDSDYRPGHPLPNGESVCEESMTPAMESLVDRVRSLESRGDVVSSWIRKVQEAPDGMTEGFALIYREAYKDAQHHLDLALSRFHIDQMRNRT